MSCLEGGSVNDGISESLCSLTYVGIWDAVIGIAERGRKGHVDGKSGQQKRL